MKALGIVLLVAGIIYFLSGQIVFEKREKVLDLGPIEAIQTEQERIPVSPVFAGALVLGGAALLIVSQNRKLTQ